MNDLGKPPCVNGRREEKTHHERRAARPNMLQTLRNAVAVWIEDDNDISLKKRQPQTPLALESGRFIQEAAARKTGQQHMRSAGPWQACVPGGGMESLAGCKNPDAVLAASGRKS